MSKVFFCKEHGYDQKTITPKAVQALQQYSWPGNVRELKNLVERLVILSGPVIDTADLPDEIQKKRAVVDFASLGNRTLKEIREEVERSYILMKLQENDWNISRTAELLGIERTNLHKKMKNYNIQRPTR